MDLNQAGVRPVSGGVPARGDSTESISLFLCGDVMTGRGIDQVLPHPGDPTLHEPYMKSAEGYVRIAERENGPIPRPVEFDYMWGDALAELDRSAPDLRIINLETSITDNDEYRPEKGIHYRMHPDNTRCITETLVSLSRHRIRRVGAGRPGVTAQG